MVPHIGSFAYQRPARNGSENQVLESARRLLVDARAHQGAFRDRLPHPEPLQGHADEDIPLLRIRRQIGRKANERRYPQRGNHALQNHRDAEEHEHHQTGVRESRRRLCPLF